MRKFTFFRTLLVVAGLFWGGGNVWSQKTTWTYSTTLVENKIGESFAGDTDGVVSVTLGTPEQASNWAVVNVNNQNRGLYNATDAYSYDETSTNVPTGGTFMVVTSEQDVHFAVGVFATDNNWLYLVKASDNSKTQLNGGYRWKNAQTLDVGKLEAGETYYLYSSEGANLNVCFNSFTAATYETYTIKYVDGQGKSIATNKEYIGLFGDVVTASEEDMGIITFEGKTYLYQEGNKELTLAKEGNVITLVYATASVADYSVNYLDESGKQLKEPTVYKDVVIGTEVSASYSEKAQFLVETALYEYVEGDETISVGENSEANVINLKFKAVEGVEAYYLQNYEATAATDWTTSTNGRFDPVLFVEGNGNQYLSVNQNNRNNNGATLTSTATVGVVNAGNDFTFVTRIKLCSSTDQTATAFNIYDANNTAKILSLAEVTKYATAWTINDDTEQKVTVCSNGGLALNEIDWITLQVTAYGNTTYLTVKDSKGNIIDSYDKTVIATLSEVGGLGKMEFVTSRYNANFAIDDVLVRNVLQSDLPTVELASSAKLEGYKTFYNAALNYEVDENTTIYTAVVNEEGTTVTLKEVEGSVVPAGEAVMLKTSAEDYTITLTPTSATSEADFSNNDLKVAEEEGAKENAYVLAVSNSRELGFYKYEIALKEGEVYLDVPATAVAPARLSIVTDGEATAINGVQSAVEAEDGVTYNVSGQVVNAGYKGIVIKNGKKYLQN